MTAKIIAFPSKSAAPDIGPPLLRKILSGGVLAFTVDELEALDLGPATRAALRELIAAEPAVDTAARRHQERLLSTLGN